MHRRFLDAELSVPPSSSSYGNRTHNSFLNDANFDTNMVIILAALLCALICALGLNTIVRCAARLTRGFSRETAAARLAATGLKKRDLRQIPVAVYGSSEEVPAAATECPICLGEFEKGERIRVLPKCNHGFHVSCIDTWLVAHASCPNCRHSLLEKQQHGTGSASGSGGERTSENGSVEQAS